VPGGTGIAAIEVARELAIRSDVEVIGVAGRHRHPPTDGFAPPIAVNSLPIGGPLLVESWLRLGWPKVESVVDNADIVHSTTIIPPATSLPLVVTIHDLAFLRHPDFFTARGNKVFRRSLDIMLNKADMVLCSSQATLEDCVTAGFSSDRLRHVPLGVRAQAITDEDRTRVRATYDLPEQFVLFVGTLEPRKNLTRLIAALGSLRDAPPLVVVGMAGWGDEAPSTAHDVRFTGFVPAHDLPALYEACTVFAFPSILEGYGLPVIEAMAHGAAVVTSRGTSTEEVAGGAAVLVDPLSVESIAAGVSEAMANRDQLRVGSIARATEVTWSSSTEATVNAYREVLGKAS
jgi:glycosyltransferase involved in cell wall biosynthesis